MIATSIIGRGPAFEAAVTRGSQTEVSVSGLRETTLRKKEQQVSVSGETARAEEGSGSFYFPSGRTFIFEDTLFFRLKKQAFGDGRQGGDQVRVFCFFLVFFSFRLSVRAQG